MINQNMMDMEWCNCEIPKIKEGRLRLREDEKCLECGKRIRKFYKTQRGKTLVLRIANEFHECQGCGHDIEKGEPYFGMTVDDLSFYSGKHTWALCLSCHRRRGNVIIAEGES